MQCRLTSNTKLIRTKATRLQSSKKHIMYKSYSQKRIIKRAKQNFGGLARTLLKRCYRTTIIWYAKLAPTRCKCFVVWECVSAHPANHQLTYESSHKNINPIWMWALNTIICMPEPGSMIMNSQFLKLKIITQRHPIPKKFKSRLIYQLRKGRTHQEPHTSVPRKFSSNRRSQWRNIYVSTHGTRCGVKLGTTGK